LSPGRLALPAPSDVLDLAGAFDAAGGRAVIVGGWVRDALAGRAAHDLDLEVFGLGPEAIGRVLADAGFSPPVGRQFPVWRRNRDGLDVALPRDGALDYSPSRAGSLAAAFRLAARHRDLTVDALGFEPREGRLLDPWGGEADLRARRLRAVDAETFVADPLRLLRVARLGAVLEAEPDAALEGLCQGLDLAGVAAERIGAELRRMILDPARPGEALAWLERIGRLDVLPEVERLAGVPQDPRWHPEGDVLVHTRMVLDQARRLAGPLAEPVADPDGECLMLAALCHDFGKPETTTQDGDRIRAIAHEAASARRARAFLGRLRFGERTVRAVEALVERHLAPSQLVAQGAGPRAYRRLARRLAPAGVSLVRLERLARADHLGRTTPEALAGRYDAGDRFLAEAEAAGVRDAPRADVVTPADLMARGVAPGPELGRLLRRCREIEDETGLQDAERVLARCLPRR